MTTVTKRRQPAPQGDSQCQRACGAIRSVRAARKQGCRHDQDKLEAWKRDKPLEKPKALPHAPYVPVSKTQDKYIGHE